MDFTLSSEPSAGSDNRLPPEDPKAGLKLKAERHGEEWILNGEKCFIANASVGKLFFIDARTDPNAPLRQGTTMFLVPHDTPGLRIGKVFNKSGWRFYQNGEMIFEDARVPHANVVGAVNGSDMKTHAAGDRTGGDLFGDLELAANALGVCASRPAPPVAPEPPRLNDSRARFSIVMPALGAGIHVLQGPVKDVDGRDKPGHDA